MNRMLFAVVVFFNVIVRYQMNVKIEDITEIKNEDVLNQTVLEGEENRFSLFKFNADQGKVEFTLHNIQGNSKLNAYYLSTNEGEFNMTISTYAKLFENRELIQEISFFPLSYVSFDLHEANDISKNQQYIIIILSQKDVDCTFSLRFTHTNDAIKSNKLSNKFVFYQDMITSLKQREFILELNQYKTGDIIEVELFPYSGITSTSLLNMDTNPHIANIEKFISNSNEKYRFVKNNDDTQTEQFVSFAFNAINSGFFLLTHKLVEIDNNKETFYMEINSPHYIHLSQDITKHICFNSSEIDPLFNNETYISIQSDECLLNINSTISQSYQNFIHPSSLSSFALDISLNAFIESETQYCVVKIYTTSEIINNSIALHEGISYETEFKEESIMSQQFQFPFIFESETNLIYIKVDISKDTNLILTISTTNSIFKKEDIYYLFKDNEFILDKEFHNKFCELNKVCTLQIKVETANKIPYNCKMSLTVSMSNHFHLEYLAHNKVHYFRSFLSKKYFYSRIGSNPISIKTHSYIKAEGKYLIVNEENSLNNGKVIEMFAQLDKKFDLSEREINVNECNNEKGCLMLIEISNQYEGNYVNKEIIDLVIQTNDVISIPLNYTVNYLYDSSNKRIFTAKLPSMVKQFSINAQGKDSLFYIEDMDTTNPCCSGSMNRNYSESSMIVFDIDNEMIANDPNHFITVKITAMNTNSDLHGNLSEVSISVHTYMENTYNETLIHFLQYRHVMETKTLNNQSFLLFEKNSQFSLNDYQVYCFAPENNYARIFFSKHSISEINTDTTNAHWINEFKGCDIINNDNPGGFYMEKENIIASIFNNNPLYPTMYQLFYVNSSLPETTIQCALTEQIMNEVVILSQFKMFYSFTYITFEFPKYLKNISNEYEVYVIIQNIFREIFVTYKNENLRLITNVELRYDSDELDNPLIIESYEISSYIVINYEIRKKNSVRFIKDDKTNMNKVYLNYELPFKFIIENNFENSSDISINIKINSFEKNNDKSWYYPFNDFIIKTYSLDSNTTEHLLNHSSIDLPLEENVCNINTFQYLQTILLSTKYSNISYLYVELSDNKTTNDIISNSFYMTISVSKKNSIYSPLEGKYFIDYLDNTTQFKDYYLYSNKLDYKKIQFELAESISNSIKYEFINIMTNQPYTALDSFKTPYKYNTTLTVNNKIDNVLIEDEFIVILLRVSRNKDNDNDNNDNKIYYFFKYFSQREKYNFPPLSFESDSASSIYVAKHEKILSSWGKITDYTKEGLILLYNKPSYYYVHYNRDITNEGIDDSLCIIDIPIYESVTQDTNVEINNVPNGFEHSVKVYGYGIYTEIVGSGYSESQEYLISTMTVLVRESDKYKVLWKVFLFLYIFVALIGFLWFGYRKLKWGDKEKVKNTFIEEDIEREKLSAINVD